MNLTSRPRAGLAGLLLAFASERMATRWLRREGRSRSAFRYRRDDGAVVRDPRTLARIAELAIPPAWREVHIAASPASAIQAWGIDARGRKQYRYHDRAVETRELRKHYRVRRLGRDLPRIRRTLAADLRRRTIDRARVAAAVAQLIERGCFRPGGERYVRENRSFGVTTLRKSHVRVEGETITFAYRGKAGKAQRHVVVDRGLARFMRAMLAAPGRRVFRYQEADGGWRDLTARDVNEYLREATGLPYTAKDFRTWGATLRLATVLAELGPARSAREATRNVNTAVRLVAADLGNTPAICKTSYIHPAVIERYLTKGETIGLHAATSARAAGRFPRHELEERALLRFLDRHFPERRRRGRVARDAGDEG